MIHTYLPRNCVVFLLLCKLTRCAIYGIHKWPTVLVDGDHYILLLKYLSNHMHFIRNGYRCFPKTNSTDPRQRVPLMAIKAYIGRYRAALDSTSQCILRNFSFQSTGTMEKYINFYPPKLESEKR